MTDRWQGVRKGRNAPAWELNFRVVDGPGVDRFVNGHPAVGQIQGTSASLPRATGSGKRQY